MGGQGLAKTLGTHEEEVAELQRRFNALAEQRKAATVSQVAPEAASSKPAKAGSKAAKASALTQKRKAAKDTGVADKAKKIKPNAKCPCGSGKKYKKCCRGKKG